MRKSRTYLGNAYEDSLGDLKIPKSVLAAIAVSALTNGGDELEHAKERVLEEWGALYINDVVRR